jgi:uncharacterized protein YbjQ (UPF0145 family)
MLLYTVENLPGIEYEAIGLVRGSIVQTKHIGKDIWAHIKQIFGGEINVYTEMINEARAIATGRMIDEAKKLEADAIVCVRFVTAPIMQNASEVLAYGTAVKLKSG